MTFPLPADVEQMVRQQMATGKYASEAELLREALRALAEDEQDLAAIQEAVAELEAGDPGVPLHEAFDALRAKHGVSLGP
jgi:putative addiction module CopG family antidote